MAVKKPALFKISFIGSIVIMCLILLGGLTVFLMPHFGWMIDGVRSESMSPTITRGTLVISRPVLPDNLTLGDIIIFRGESAKESYVCHRIIGITRNSPLNFITQGDANAARDPKPVPSNNVLGEVAWHIPVLGFAAIFIKTPLGFIVSVIIPGFTIAFMCLSSLRSELIQKKKGALHDVPEVLAPQK
jgi:signal peptidase